MVACVLIPRFALRVAYPGGRLDEAVALAPLSGGRQVVGEVSAAAEADGVEAGMPLSEALARCPSLRLVPSDPVGVAERWDRLLERLEGIGAAVESERPGEAFFEVDGLLGIHGGALEGVIAAAREAARTRVRIAVAPNRFAALVAAGREAVVTRRALGRFLAPLPVATLAARLGPDEPEARELVGALRRLGLGTLGRLAGITADQAADRFGPIGLRALRLARGEDTPLRPRRPARGAGRRDRAARGGRGVAAGPRPGAPGGPSPRRPGAAGEDRAGAAPLRPCSRAAAAGASSRGSAGRRRRRG